MTAELNRPDGPHGRSTRAPAAGRRGMVASGHPCATQAGLDVLKDGGNAFDAVVAVAATLNAVEPYMSGVGGVGVALLYVAREGRTRVLNFSGRAAARAAPEAYTEQTKTTGPRAPLVPGNVAGWTTLHETYGKLSLARCFNDAIDYAEHGFPLTPFAADMLRANWAHLTGSPTVHKAFLQNAAQPPRAGALLRQPGLARSLSAIAEGGAKIFYQGEIADKLVRGLEAAGGLIDAEDLGSYAAEWQEPLSARYGGYEVRVPPPNSSGFQIAETVNVLSGYAPLEYGSVDSLHLMLEAVKLAIADRVSYAGDPDFVDIPIERLLSSEYAEALRRRISLTKAAPLPAERFTGEGAAVPRARMRETEKWWRDGLTTHFAAADSEGNVATVTQTLGNTFGSRFMPDGTGIFLNNMCLWFDIDPRIPTPNLVGPRKRVDFCLAPSQVFADGKLRLSLGTPGSYGILQTTVQMLHHIADAGMNIQEAIEAPRFRLMETGVLNFEGRFPESLLDGLKARGHEITRLPLGWSRIVGGAHGIHVTEQGTYQGGADPRRDGLALGF